MKWTIPLFLCRNIRYIYISTCRVHSPKAHSLPRFARVWSLESFWNRWRARSTFFECVILTEAIVILLWSYVLFFLYYDLSTEVSGTPRRYRILFSDNEPRICSQAFPVPSEPQEERRIPCSQSLWQIVFLIAFTSFFGSYSCYGSSQFQHIPSW